MVLFIVVASAIILLAAYFTYGKFLANTVFKLDDKNPVPSVEMEDGVDYVPAHAAGTAFFGHCRSRAY